MNKLIILLGGIFGLFALSWLGLVVVPYSQLAALQPQVDPDNVNDVYPVAGAGLTAEGRRVYAANGCASCHTQQILPGGSGADIGRKWGTRQTVARDYLYENPLLVGSLRIGPDLSNVALRHGTAAWHYEHLYNPRSKSPTSVMPAFRYLFEKREIVGEKSMDALDLRGSDAPKDGWQIVPTAEAKALVAYLLSLNRTHPLKESVTEAKLEEPAAAPPTDAAVPAGDNSPAAVPATAGKPAPNPAEGSAP